MSDNALTKKAITNAVVKHTAQHPLSVYPMAIALLGGASAFAFGLGPLTTGAMAGGALLALAGWSGNFFFRKQKFANSYIVSIRNKIKEERFSILANIESELMSINETEGLKQLVLFEEKYNNLCNILEKKMDPSELTFIRYSTMAEQVYKAGLDNLESAYLAKKSISAINVKDIADNLLEGDQTKLNPSEKAKAERLKLHNDQNERANFLIGQNEEALTQLDHVTTRLANIKTEQGHAAMDIEQAMSGLSDLIKRTEKYSQ